MVTDIYPFHLQARKLNVWTLGFIMYVHYLALVSISGVLICGVVRRSFHLLHLVSLLHGQSRFIDRACERTQKLNCGQLEVELWDRLHVQRYRPHTYNSFP